MALDLMMGSYAENHQKQHSTPTTTAAPIIISSSTTTSGGGGGGATTHIEVAEKLIAHETAAGLQSVENFINFLSTTTDINYHRSGEAEKREAQVQISNPNTKQDNSSSNSGKPAYEFDLNCQAMADDAVTKFRRVISLLGRTRTGHARFRRGPSSIAAADNPSNYSSSTPSPTPSPPRPSSTSFRFFPLDDRDRKHSHVLESSAAPVLCPKPIKQIPMSAARNNHQFDFATAGRNESAAALINFSSCSPVVSGGNSLVTGSTLTGEVDLAAETGRKHQKKQIYKDGIGVGVGVGVGGSGSVSENGTAASFHITNYSSCSAGASGRRPPLSSASFKIRKCNSSMSGGNTGSGGGRCGGTSSGRCHCSRKRKLRSKRSVRVPAISSRMADIPPDDYSWRKYGQKPIKGSPHPRGYYKCSTVRGCPARKHVERALDDPAMLIVTYEGEHNHSISNVEATTTNLILESS